MNETEAIINSRLHALLGMGGDAVAWQALHADASRVLGQASGLTLRIECGLTRQRVRNRPVAAALADWGHLRERAENALPSHHPTVMAIRSRHTDCLARRGEPGDLDRVVQIRRDELAARTDANVGAMWTGIARAELAIAHLDRALFGAFDPALRVRHSRDDLTLADQLIEGELDRRVHVHGAGDPFTWEARTVRGAVLLAWAQRVQPRQCAARYAEVAGLGGELVAFEWERTGRHSALALRGQLLRADALLGLGQATEAERQARLAAVLARGRSRRAESRALMTLARATAVRDRRAARVTARLALAVRLDALSPAGHQVAEARQLVKHLEQDVGDDKHDLWHLLSGNLAHGLDEHGIDARGAPAPALVDESIPA